MIRYSQKYAVWYDDETGEEVGPPQVDHSQNPLIGIALLLVVLYAAWVMSGSPQIIITGV
jgi:hypothetical protein